MSGEIYKRFIMPQSPESSHGHRKETSSSRVENTQQPLFTVKESRRSETGSTITEFEVGTMKVIVEAIPSESITEQQKKEISEARIQAYQQMWGGDDEVNKSIGWDEYDESSGATQYIASCFDKSYIGIAPKRFSMRKLTFAPNDTLPVDFTAWCADESLLPGVKPLPLWDHMQDAWVKGTLGKQWVKDEHTQEGKKIGLKEQVAVISRAATSIDKMDTTGTTRETDPRIKALRQSQSAVLFAAIQYVATEGDTKARWFCELAPALQKRILSLEDENGTIHTFDFQRTDQSDWFFPYTRARLNREEDVVKDLLIHYPGYWATAQSVGKILRDLVDEGLLHGEDLATVINNVRSKGEERAKKEHTEVLGGSLPPVTIFEEKKDYSTNANAIIDEITERAINLKYLVPFWAKEEMVNAQLSSAEVRRRIIAYTQDGPFSASFTPADWRKSAEHMLNIAASKHATNTSISLP